MGDQFTLSFMIIKIMKMYTCSSLFIFQLTNNVVHICFNQIDCKLNGFLDLHLNWPKRPTAETTHSQNDPPK